VWLDSLTASLGTLQLLPLLTLNTQSRTYALAELRTRGWEDTELRRVVCAVRAWRAYTASVRARRRRCNSWARARRTDETPILG